MQKTLLILSILLIAFSLYFYNLKIISTTSQVSNIPEEKNTSTKIQLGNYTVEKQVVDNVATYTLHDPKNTLLDTLTLDGGTYSDYKEKVIAKDNMDFLIITYKANPGSEFLINTDNWYEVANSKFHKVLSYVREAKTGDLCYDPKLESKYCNVKLETNLDLDILNKITVHFNETATNNNPKKDTTFETNYATYVWNKSTEMYTLSKRESKLNADLFSMVTGYAVGVWYVDIK